MKWFIPIIFLLLIAVNVQSLCTDRIYQVNMFYENQELILGNIEKTTGCYPSNSNFGYKYEIISDTDEVLRYSYFGNPEIIYTDSSLDGMQGGPIKPQVSEFSILIPVIKDAEKLGIYDLEDQKVAEIELPEYNIKSFESGQVIVVSVFPSEKGVYKEAYIYSENELKDTIIFNCDYMCYRDLGITYMIPDWPEGEYSIIMYDYNKKRWRSTNFMVDVKKDSELVVDLR